MPPRKSTAMLCAIPSHTEVQTTPIATFMQAKLAANMMREGRCRANRLHCDGVQAKMTYPGLNGGSGGRNPLGHRQSQARHAVEDLALHPPFHLLVLKFGGGQLDADQRPEAGDRILGQALASRATGGL